MEEEKDPIPLHGLIEDSNSMNETLSEQLFKCQDLIGDQISDNLSPNKTEDSSFVDTLHLNHDSSENSAKFCVDQTAMPIIPETEQVPELKNLGVCAYDQTQFEMNIMDQVDKALKQEEEKLRKADLEKEVKSVSDDIRLVHQRLSHLEKALLLAPKEENLMTSAAKREVIAIKKEQENKLKHLKKLEAKQKMLNACLSGTSDIANSNFSNNDADDSDLDEETLCHLNKVFTPKETEEERLIRTGEMTPFGTRVFNKAKAKKIMIPENQLTDFDRFLLDQAEEKQKRKPVKTHPKHAKKKPLILKCNSTSSIEDCQPSTSKNYSVENNWPSVSKNYGVENDQTSTNHCSKLSEEVASIINKRRTKPALKKMKLGTKFAEGIARKKRKISLVKNYLSDDEISDFEDNNDSDGSLSDKDYKPDDQAFYSSDDSLKESDASAKKGKMTKSKNSENKKKSPHNRYKRVVDDGNRGSYIKRLKQYEKTELLKKHQKIMESEDGVVDSDEEFTEFDDFKVPTHVWGKLYRHQQTGVRWLWELHQQNCGGIVGDEMGLGKTIQIIVFLAGLEVTNVRTNGNLFRGRGPVVLVCPTTVMHQWVKEFHTWWPSARVAILHESGSYVGKKPILVAAINQTRGILVTSYSGLVSHQLSLLNYDWHYVILDEGHKIRNPDAQATLIAKQFRTPHRLILSGSPIQNNLKELWSLFDFIFPGKLGTLPVFMQQFSVPIVQGGYANASQVQVQTAFKCASVLRDTIKPYLLRRMKADVKMSIQLPNKNEQVLFCKLSDDQKELYKAYIASSEVQSIISARLQIFVGLINLRKICNHPDLYTGGPKIFKDTNLSTLSEDMHYGFYKRSGKMIVVDSLLRLWHKQGHRVLLFTQSRQMIAILELFVKNRNYTYMKMDGSTAISSRQPAIAKFNSDPSIFIFLLTTRVGGLGVNLTSANRVIIYDPDWNPSTDAQARERSWRIGQERQVTIYRLLTAGTIEEKIYHRQIFKQFVTNRVLKDPRQRRFFKSNDLYELFTFSEMGKEGTETSAIFAGTGSEIKPLNKGTRTNKSKGGFWAPSKPMDIEVSFSSSKVQKMKELAKRLSSQLAQKQPESEKIQNECMSSEKSESDSKMKNSLLPAVTQEEKNSPKKGQSPNRNSKSITIKTPNEVTKKKHSKRKWQSTIVEGEKIKFLVKADVYKAAGEETEENSQNDDYVLSRLFKKSGVHTALKHDVIVDASDPDYMLVEGEANRVAQEAIKALKQSRRQCARAVEGIPTWTGTNGNVKRRFGVKKRLPPSSTTSSQKSELSEESNPGPSGIVCKYTFSPAKDNQESTESSSNRLSSASLLSAIKKRKEMFSITQNGEESDSDHDELISHELPSHTEYDELLVDIRNFIAFGSAVDGQAKTEEIVEKFKDKLPVEHTAVFRSLLTKICTFSRISGDGTWILKEEFR